MDSTLSGRPPAEIASEISIFVLTAPFVYVFAQLGAFRRAPTTTGGQLPGFEAGLRALLGCCCFHALMAIAEYARRCFQGSMVSTWMFLVAVGSLVLLLVALSRRILQWGVWPGDLVAAPAAAGALWCLATKAHVSMLKQASPLQEWLQLPPWLSLGNALCVSGLLVAVALALSLGTGALSRELQPQEVEATIPESSILTDDGKVLSAGEARLPPPAIAALFNAPSLRSRLLHALGGDAATAALTALPQLPDSALVVELGCGGGGLARRMLALQAAKGGGVKGGGIRYLGLDLARKQVQAAHSVLQQVAAVWQPPPHTPSASPEEQLLRWLGCSEEGAAASAPSLAQHLAGPMLRSEEEAVQQPKHVREYCLLHTNGDPRLPWLPAQGVHAIAAVHVLEGLPSAAIGGFLCSAHGALVDGGTLLLVAFTMGRTPLASALTCAWAALHGRDASAVLGYRPISLMGHVTAYSTGSMQWRVHTHDFVTSMGVTSELLLLRAVHAAGEEPPSHD